MVARLPSLCKGCTTEFQHGGMAIPIKEYVRHLLILKLTELIGLCSFLSLQLLPLSNFNPQLQNRLTLAPQISKPFNFDPRAI